MNERLHGTVRFILFCCTCMLSIRTLIKYIHKVRETSEYQFENVFDILGPHSGVAGDVTTFRLAHSFWRFEGTECTLSFTCLTLKMNVQQAFETPVFLRQSTWYSNQDYFHFLPVRYFGCIYSHTSIKYDKIGVEVTNFLCHVNINGACEDGTLWEISLCCQEVTLHRDSSTRTVTTHDTTVIKCS